MNTSIHPGFIQKVLLLAIFLFAAQTLKPAVADNGPADQESLVGKIDYSFVGHLGETDDAGRTLVWEATLEGDIHGTMKWWFVNPPPVSPVAYTGGKTSFYAARWEVWVDDRLALAGESGGKTVFPDGADGIWDGHGRVTEASGRFEAYLGRVVYESGPVIAGDDPPRTLSGTGMFLVY